MNMRELINVVDIDRISARTLYSLMRALETDVKVDHDDLIGIMYGNAMDDAEEELRRKKIQAQIRKLDADAQKSRAEAFQNSLDPT